MKAAMLVADRRIDIVDQPLPVLAADECRVRLKAVGVCSSDIQRGFDKGAYFYPLIMGHEMAGEVAEAGAACTGVKPGDRVVIFPLLPCFSCEACAREAYAQCHDYGYYGSRRHGGYAEYLDVKPWNLLAIPDGVSFEDAATLEPLSVVLHALRRAEPEPDARVLIVGAGFLGLLLAQLMQRLHPGCNVTIADRNAFKLDIAKPYVVRCAALSGDEAWQAFLAAEKNSYDVVFEATGVPSAFGHAISLAKHGGRVLWMGNITGELTLPKPLVSSVLRKELTILGSWNSSYRPGKQDDWKDALALIAAGLSPAALVTHWVTLEEVPDTLRRLHGHKSGAGRFESVKAMIRHA